MSSQTTLGLAAAALIALAVPASAQDLPDWSNGWSGQATIYAWLPAINGAQEGPDGQPLVDLDQANVLESLDMAFMGAAEIRKDRFGLLLDIVYADLSTDGEWVQGRIDTETGTRLGMYTVAAAYRVYDVDRTFVDLYGGARLFDTKLTFSLDTANLGGFDREANLDWTDPIVGIRGATPLTERWSVSGFADVGGFDARDDLSWEIYGGMNYAFSDAWAGTVGYRYMSILYQASDRARLDIDIQGPVLGVTYKF